MDSYELFTHPRTIRVANEMRKTNIYLATAGFVVSNGAQLFSQSLLFFPVIGFCGCCFGAAIAGVMTRRLERRLYEEKYLKMTIEEKLDEEVHPG
jgi:hypothetical protein